MPLLRKNHGRTAHRNYLNMYTLDKHTLQTIEQKTSQARDIVIIGHTGPDADAVSSVLGLKAYLQKLNPKARITGILPDEMPEFLQWMEGAGQILIGQEAVPAIQSADLLFFVDLNEAKRVGELQETVEKARGFKIIIDHHPKPENFADILLSFPSAGSTTEIIYSLLKQIDPAKIDLTIARHLLTGILTDTGCFCHDSATSVTLATAAELLDYGIDKGELVRNIYNNYSYDRMKLMGYALQEKFEILPQYSFGYIWLTQEELERFNYKTGDHENFVNLPLSVRGIKISAMFMERDDIVRVSLRSAGNIDVGEIARKYLDGGGHKNAAGGNMEKPIEKAIDTFINKILPQIPNHENNS